MEIINKRVVVTGAASGIGKALALAFKQADARSVVVVDINTDGVEKTAKEIDGVAITADVSKEKDIENMIQKANTSAGGIDIFCSNAGIGGAPGFIEVETSDWQHIWEVNVMSHIFAAKHLIPQMLEQGGGYLVNTASAAGLLSQPGVVSYAVTKAAAVSFAEWIKITFGKRGIGVSCLCPQGVRTPMLTEPFEDLVGVDGIIEPEVVAEDTLDAIKNEKFLITPHKEVLNYIKYKASDRDGWINSMQKFQEQFEESFSALKDFQDLRTTEIENQLESTSNKKE